MADVDLERSESETEPTRVLLDKLADAFDPLGRNHRPALPFLAAFGAERVKDVVAGHRRLIAGLIRVLARHVRCGENRKLEGTYDDFIRYLLHLPNPPSHRDPYKRPTLFKTGDVSAMFSRFRNLVPDDSKGVRAVTFLFEKAQVTIHLDGTDSGRHDAILWIGLRDATGAELLADTEPPQRVPPPDIAEDHGSFATVEVSRAPESALMERRAGAALLPGSFLRRNYLRPTTLDFRGRDELLGHMAELATQDDRAIIGVHGMGGLGKTELALALGHRLTPVFPDAQLFIEMPEEDDDEARRSVMVRALAQLGVPAPSQSIALADEVYRRANGSRGLIVFDDVVASHVLADLPPPLGWLFIITTRHRFSLAGAHWPRVDGLAKNDARELLVAIAKRRATSISRDQMADVRWASFGGFDGMRDFADLIVQLCGFLPLAIRTAGAFLQLHPHISFPTYAHLLADERTRLDALEGDGQSTSVRASFNISFQRIPPNARALFAELGIFAGAFTESAARSVCPTFSDQALAELRRHALIDYLEEQDRFRLHDLLRAYARENLVTEPELYDVVSRQHAVHFAARAQEIVAGYYPVVKAYRTTGWPGLIPPHSDGKRALREAEEQSIAETADILQGARWAAAEQARSSASVVTSLFRQNVEALIVDNRSYWSPFWELDVTFLKTAAIPYANDVSMQPFRAWRAYAEGANNHSVARLEEASALVADRPLLRLECAQQIQNVHWRGDNLPGLRDALSVVIAIKSSLGHEDLERLKDTRLLTHILIHQGRYDEAARWCGWLQEVNDVIRQQGRTMDTADTTSLLGRVQLESAVSDFGERWFRMALEESRGSQVDTVDTQRRLIRNSAFLALARAMKHDGTAVDEALQRFNGDDSSNKVCLRDGLMTAEVVVGRAMIFLDQHERAIELFDEALANRPADVVERALYPAIARYYRAQANAALGRRNAAVEDLRVAAPILAFQESPLAANAQLRLRESEAAT